jgi:nucleoside-diphosphate-sugar epimerase
MRGGSERDVRQKSGMTTSNSVVLVAGTGGVIGGHLARVLSDKGIQIRVKRTYSWVLDQLSGYRNRRQLITGSILQRPRSKE